MTPSKRYLIEGLSILAFCLTGLTALVVGAAWSLGWLAIIGAFLICIGLHTLLKPI